MVLRLAIAQLSPVNAPTGPFEAESSQHPFPTLQANLRKATEYVKSASAQGAEIVVFPEYFLQGIANDSRQYLTFPSTHLLEYISDLAKTYDIAIVGSIVHGTLPGSAPPFPTASPFAEGSAQAQSDWARHLEQNPEHENAVLLNTAFYVEADGEVKGRYVKQNLWHPEREYLTPGVDDHQVFDTKWGKAGLLICWDLSHPQAAQTLADLGVDLVFAPTYWLSTDSEPILLDHQHEPTYELNVLSSLCAARSFETETVWIMCNAGGDATEGFMGGSGCWAPLRGKIGGFEGEEETVRVFDVDVNVLKDARRLYKIREDWSQRETR